MSVWLDGNVNSSLRQEAHSLPLVFPPVRITCLSSLNFSSAFELFFDDLGHVFDRLGVGVSD